MFHDRELLKRFLKPFEKNYPNLCDDREITVIDCTPLRDPEHDTNLRSHRGTHVNILEQVVAAGRFLQVNQTLKQVTGMPDRKHLIINVCKSGRHRSVANKTM